MFKAEGAIEGGIGGNDLGGGGGVHDRHAILKGCKHAVERVAEKG